MVFIFPMIKNAQEAKRMIDATLYPPYGTRGFGPHNATAYGFYDTSKYISETVDNMCRFIQIEHIDAVNDLDEIIKNEYIDGYIFGPYDLSGSINELGNVFGNNTTELIKKTMKTLKENGKYSGVSTGDVSEKVLSHWHNMGVDMISAGWYFGFIQKSALDNRITLEKIHKNNFSDSDRKI